MSNKRAVCLTSGGLDSAVAVAMALSEGYEVYLLMGDYGQKTRKKELDCIFKLAQFYSGTHLEILDLTWLGRFGASGMTDATTHISLHNADLAYVPFRNTILISAGVAWAETVAADCVLIGSTGGIHYTPDNYPQYFEAVQKVVQLGTRLKTDIHIHAPFCHSQKCEVIAKGIELNVPFEITWSCYNRDDRACGECHSCKGRLQGFRQLGISDPLPYL